MDEDTRRFGKALLVYVVIMGLALGVYTYQLWRSGYPIGQHVPSKFPCVTGQEECCDNPNCSEGSR
ncbi:hypothetical protein LCGC14_1679280 [marine sediment metagenome]|uniref:Uncharacterized protein n=1 Tax=marine sediment metagenome TaxID=412755 RepID=A0A0F9K4X3_9ZZZZ